jgi:hypothetical protein
MFLRSEDEHYTKGTFTYVCVPASRHISPTLPLQYCPCAVQLWFAPRERLRPDDYFGNLPGPGPGPFQLHRQVEKSRRDRE